MESLIYRFLLLPETVGINSRLISRMKMPTLNHNLTTNPPDGYSAISTSGLPNQPTGNGKSNLAFHLPSISSVSTIYTAPTTFAETHRLNYAPSSPTARSESSRSSGSSFPSIKRTRHIKMRYMFFGMWFSIIILYCLMLNIFSTLFSVNPTNYWCPEQDLRWGIWEYIPHKVVLLLWSLIICPGLIKLLWNSRDTCGIRRDLIGELG